MEVLKSRRVGAENWHYRVRNELLQLLGCVAVVDVILGLHHGAQHGLHPQQRQGE